MKQFLILISIVCISLQSFSQESLNAYKYVLVNNQYDFQNTPNQYRLNEQMVFELKKKNFDAYLKTQTLPNDMSSENCNTLRLVVDVKKGLATTMYVSFIDCNDSIIYELTPAKSKLKSFEKGYRAALRLAIASFNDYTHKYNGSKDITSIEPVSNSESPVAVILTNSDEPGSVKKNSFKSIDGTYTLQEQDSDYVILKNNSVIGTLKKSSSGCYLAVTSAFIGIGFQEKEMFKIEFEKQGIQTIEFKL